MEYEKARTGGSRPSRWLFGPAAMVAASVAFAALVVGLVYLVVFATPLFAFGDDAREVPKAVLLPLPSGLVLVSGPEQRCPQGAQPIGDCSLTIVIGPERVTGDVMGALRGHLRDRGWQLAPGRELALYATFDALCLEGKTPAQLGQYLRRYDYPPVAYVEGHYGLSGGLPAVDDRRLLFLRVGYEGCTR